jgi:RHS repeat-associated protein
MTANNPNGVVSCRGARPALRRKQRPPGTRPALLLSGVSVLVSILLCALPLRAATFTNNASIQVTDPTGALTSTSGIFTLSCWLRISIPTGLTLSDNMDILMDRTDGIESQNFSYLLRYNIANNAVEFVTHGSSASYSKVLIQAPYLERWYHVAVSRSSSVFSVYVDGRPVLPVDATSVGGTVGSGLTIGGIGGSSKQFFGDIIEVAIYSSALSQSLIQDRMFKDQGSFPNLHGYYKLAYSTNASDLYHNFAPAPPSGTDPATRVGSGTIAFDQVDQAGEQSLFDSNLNHGENALTPLSGAFAWNQTALARPTPGIAFDLEFGYSSALPTQGPVDGTQDPYDQRVMGPKWRQTFDTRVVLGTTVNEVDLVKWDGSLEAWTRTNQFSSLTTRHHEYRGEMLQLTATAEVQWTTPERLIYLFRDPGDGTAMAGRLERISDFNGNTVQLQWNENAVVVTNVVDTAGGNFAFKYDSARTLLTNVTFGAWQVNFTYDPTNRLISKTLTNTSGPYTAVNTSWQFLYNSTNGLLEKIVDSRNITNLFIAYDQYGRKTNEIDALGRTTQTRYGVPGPRQITRTDPATNLWLETYDRKGHILAQTDPLANTTSYTYDTNGNRISITEPLGWTTYFGYDNRANVVAKTNALGEVAQWVFHTNFNKAIQQITPQPLDVNGQPMWTNFYAYDAGGNLTNHSDGLGTLVNYTYLTNGLVATSTDANGNPAQFGYDTSGFLNSRTDAASNTTSYLLNDVGWKLREVNALSDPTTFAYDVNGNVTRIEDVLARVFYKSFDPNGNLLSGTDGKGQLTTYAYDPANQRTNMVDRTRSNTWVYVYTSRGKLDHVTNPLSFSATNFYDSANRLVRISDPLGNSVTNQYDANGNLTFFFDKLGQRWARTYDRLNRAATEADALGNTKTMVYDIGGRLSQIISPNNYPSQHFYDGRGRLTRWVDPQAFPWVYAYDGVGNITNITDANLGHYVMVYSNRNERILERNQDNFEWNYTYDELLRLKTQKDPNGITRTPTYDAAGRVLFIDFNPTSRRDSLTYDDNDNPKTLSRRASGITTTLKLVYDPLDRVQEQDDALNQTVLYGHDALGQVTSITYPGGKTLTNFFDPLGRLTNQVDWASRQTSYTYDLADRLLTRTYPNGVLQSNVFDNAGRITGLSYHVAAAPSQLPTNAINIALSYAYDRNGNRTGSGERGTLAWPLPSLSDETSQFTASGRITNRVDSLNSTNHFTYQFDPSGNMTNATGPESFSLSYDEDNRVMAIKWDCGITEKLITNRYDALGRRISKTLDAQTTGFVLSLHGGMERTLCDLDGNGNVIAWYVHGPDLCYKVDYTNGLTCYHGDAMADIMALTDGKTNTVIQYAYTPYGRSLGLSSLSSNLQAQIYNPYTFVGSQGVMNEAPGLFFMRARYYSAEASVFLSTDPMKKIGPGWKPTAYDYAEGNAIAGIDPTGNLVLLDAWAIGAAGEIADEGADDLARQLSADIGGSKRNTELLINAKNFITGTKEVVEGVRIAATGTDPANYIAGQVGKWSGKAINAFVPLMANAYLSGVYSVGNALGGVLYSIFGVGAVSAPRTTLYSSTAGTTPMALLTTPSMPQSSGAPFQFQTPQGSSANQTASARTVSAAAAGGSITAATSRPPASPSGTSGSTSGSTYTVRPGDTLGNIGYANGSSASAIGAANGIQNLNLIYPGQVLNIPHHP